MPMAQVKSIVFQYIMTYYNRQRIYTANSGGLPPAISSVRQRTGRISRRFWVFTFCTALDFSSENDASNGDNEKVRLRF